MSLRELLVYNRTVSSAKWCLFEFFIDQLKSFMCIYIYIYIFTYIYIYIYIYMRNNKGTKMEPRSTPYFSLDFRSFIIDGCILSSVARF